MTAALVDDLRDVVGARDVLVDADVRAPYESDWTRRWSGTAVAVVRPAGAGEVAAVLRACAAHGASVVPQGGNTGLVGASVPRAERQVVLCTTRMTELGDVDPATAQLRVGAGVTLAALQERARAAGLDAGVDFGARDSATVGGIVACDAGGIHAVRHGTARARVAGMRAVLADGSVVERTSGLLKDNAGYDLPALLIGSEGTLGVVCEVLWRLVPASPARALALVPLDSVAEAARLVALLRPELPSLELLELMTDAGMRLVVDHLGASAPTRPAAAYLLVGCAAAADPLDELAAALDAAGAGERAVVAADAAARERLLRLRESHTEAIGAAGVPHKLDVGVPLARLAEFAERLETTVAGVAPGAELVVFGHLGDGNLHVNVLGPDPDDGAVDEAVLTLVADCGGTISAEHGVGVQKARYLPLVRSPAEIAAMRAIKSALDPAGLLNPGAVLP